MKLVKIKTHVTTVTIVLVLLVVLKTQFFSLSLVMTTTVNLVILLLMEHGNTLYTQLIHCGMVKTACSEGACCTAPGLPWFHNVLNTTTTDYLELRVCADEVTTEDDVPVSFYELYVK